jgi:pimeloyl-ACP methyl ester carboxylesterase
MAVTEADIRFETVSGVGGVSLRVAVKGEGPLVVFVHGFPESWYSWRHQIAALAEAGYTAAAMDVRGYGGSGKPEAIEAYDMETLAGDVAAVIDALGQGEPAVIVGHDWGAPIVWNTALVQADKVRAVAGLSVPHLPVGPMHFLDMAKAMFTAQGKFFYIVYFQEPGVAEAELERDVSTTMAKFAWVWSGDAPDGTIDMSKPVDADLMSDITLPDTMPGWYTDADHAYYVTQFEASGFRGPLNRYRNFPRDHAFLRALPSQKITQPALFIGGTRDGAIRMFPFDAVEMMKPNFADLRSVQMLEGIGHWTQQEAPEAVNAALLEWLGGL